MYNTPRVAPSRIRRMPAQSPRASIALTPGVSVAVIVRRSVLAYSTSRAAVAKYVTCPTGKKKPTAIAPVCTVIRPASIARNASVLYPLIAFKVTRSIKSSRKRRPGKYTRHNAAIARCSSRFVTVKITPSASRPYSARIATTIPTVRIAKNSTRTALFAANFSRPSRIDGNALSGSVNARFASMSTAKPRTAPTPSRASRIGTNANASGTPTSSANAPAAV